MTTKVALIGDVVDELRAIHLAFSSSGSTLISTNIENPLPQRDLEGCDCVIIGRINLANTLAAKRIMDSVKDPAVLVSTGLSPWWVKLKAAFCIRDVSHEVYVLLQKLKRGDFKNPQKISVNFKHGLSF